MNSGLSDLKERVTIEIVELTDRDGNSLKIDDIVYFNYDNQIKEGYVYNEE